MVEDHVHPLIRVGTSGWSDPTWVGPFYAPGTSASRMLPEYARVFRTVEAHSPHRRTPTAAGLLRWTGQVPEDFRFAPKAHTGITHRRDLEGLDGRVAAFFQALSPLGVRLGPVLFVLPHRQPDLGRLDALLDALPPGAQAAFELAPAWRVEPVLSRLSARSVALAVVDRDDDPGEGQPTVDAPLTYVRLRRTAYTARDLDQWAHRLAAAAAGARAVYAFVKHDEEGTGPRYARDLVKRLQGEA